MLLKTFPGEGTFFSTSSAPDNNWSSPHYNFLLVHHQIIKGHTLIDQEQVTQNYGQYNPSLYYCTQYRVVIDGYNVKKAIQLTNPVHVLKYGDWYLKDSTYTWC